MRQVELNQLQLAPVYLEMLKDLLKKYVPNAEVWAYGSRVTGSGHEGSDLDVVLRNGDNLSAEVDGWLDLTEAVQQSSLPILLDIHLWATLPEAFHRNIEDAFVVIQAAT